MKSPEYLREVYFYFEVSFDNKVLLSYSFGIPIKIENHHGIPYIDLKKKIFILKRNEHKVVYFILKIIYFLNFSKLSKINYRNFLQSTRVWVEIIKLNDPFLLFLTISTNSHDADLRYSSFKS